MREKQHTTSRRGVLKTGALATSALALGGIAGAGTVAAEIGDGRVADYHLNNLNYNRRKGVLSEGHVHDSSPYKNDGVWKGDTEDPVIKNGAVGNAYGFDGSSDYVEVDHSDSLDFERTDSFSMATWAKFENASTTARNIEVLAAKRKNSEGYPGYILWRDYDEVQFQLQHANNNRLWMETDGAGLNNTDYVHIAAVYRGGSSPSDIDIYVNGVAQSLNTRQNNLSASISHTEPFRIGRQHYDLALPYEGLLDEVRVYNRVLSAEEVGELFAMMDDSA